MLIFEQPEADVCASRSSRSFLVLTTSCRWCQRTYGAAIDTLEQVGKVVDSLYAKVMSTLVYLELMLLLMEDLQTVKLA